MRVTFAIDVAAAVRQFGNPPGFLLPGTAVNHQPPPDMVAADRDEIYRFTVNVTDQLAGGA